MVSSEELAYRPALYEVSQHKQREGMFLDRRWENENRQLIEAAAASRRFGGTRLAFYVNEVDEKESFQFSAITFFLENGLSYVAFRGTDESFTGWKEDLNMSFSDPVPSQLKSVAYIEKYAPRLTGNFMVGGHSKGGNLAVYAAAKLPMQIEVRITDIFNHDGPGFTEGVLSEEEYNNVKGKIRKTLPESSIFGMLLYQKEPYRVISSSQSGIMQHDPFSWLVEDGEFVVKERLKNGQVEFNDALNRWIGSLSDEQRRVFIDTLYQVMAASDAKDLSDFVENWKRSVNNVIFALGDIDTETKSLVWEVLRTLLESFKLEFYDERQNWLREKAAQIREKMPFPKK